MSHHWHTLFAVHELPLDEYRVVDLETISLLVGYHQGSYYAIENRCSHDDTELEGGPLEGGEIICPRHGAGFCLYTGKVTRPPAFEAIRTFPVRVEQGKIQIQLIGEKISF